ncbi:M23 family metallopeptidase [[Phormidium] sp. LEGE 05292]|uniref:M23 family metallopeptidase n=1 Tax=[Phormidium] sp. LEGE 05292 TaxID=767427 RepID=UPI001D1394A5|nr:M23 family metallopeptidase [Phormidium sp. LEGE 05292]
MEKPNYENEQIKVTNPENEPTNNSDTSFWQRSLLMNSLGWLGAIAFLSSSIVWVGIENSHSGTALAAPDIPDIMPKAVPDVPAPPAKEPDPVFIRRTPNPTPNSARTRSQNRASQSRSNSGNTNTNSYIDPTDYSIGATNRRDLPGRSYQPPSSVVFRERYKPRQRVVPEQFSIEEPSPDVATVRPRVRRNTVIVRRSDTTRTQISRAPRTYDIKRPSSAEISRAPRTYEIERRTRSTEISRAPRTYEIERITIEPSNSRVSRRRLDEGIQNTETARVTRQRGTAVAAINQVTVGPIKVTPNGIRMTRSGVIRRNETRIASTNISGLTSGSRNNQMARNRVLNYYYNSVNPSDSSDNESNPTNLAMIFPLAIPAQITSVFGWRIHPITGERGFHAGTDIGAPMGTPVLAAHAGKVAIADFLGGYGLAVVLRHNQDAQETRYGHLSEVTVKPGDWVEQGTVIGRVGDSGNTNGPHLHFEVREQTPQGWVAKNPGVQLEYSLARLVRAFQSGQATLPQDTQPYELPPNTLQTEKLAPQIPIPSAELPEIPIPGTDAPPPLFASGN